MLKFGGSSLASLERIKLAAGLAAKSAESHRILVVISALGGVTEELIRLFGAAKNGFTSELTLDIERLKQRHLEILDAIEGDNGTSAIRTEVETLFAELAQTLAFVYRANGNTLSEKDKVMSFGERLSVRIFAAALKGFGCPAYPVDSHTIIRTNDRFGEAGVDFEATNKLIRDAISIQNGQIPVITGFIGSTDDNRLTTLGRSGSDITAGIIGGALGVDEVEIWTDTDGILTADPRLADSARTIAVLGYDEAEELGYLGAKVLHPKTVRPLKHGNIPLTIRNTFNPVGPITRVNGCPNAGGMTKSVNAISGLSMIGISNRSGSVIAGFAGKTLDALTDAGIKPHHFSVSGVDSGLEFFVGKDERTDALQALSLLWENEATSQTLQIACFDGDVALLHVTGDSSISHGELAGNIIPLLRKRGIVPLWFSRGNRSRHLALAIQQDQLKQAVSLINENHCLLFDGFGIFVAGIGTVGSELIHYLGKLIGNGFDARLIGSCNSRFLKWEPSGLNPSDALDGKSGLPVDWKNIAERLKNRSGGKTIFVDATGSPEVAEIYGDLLEAGVHVVTPSKIANSGDQARFDQLDALGSNGACFHYEATAGAGLPLIGTIRNLRKTGDRVTEIKGVLSGTMTYVFGCLEAGMPFSEAVISAKENGFSEPDPRDDLSGEDVARKFLTLARVAGFCLERDDIEVDNLVPEALRDLGYDGFRDKLPDFDAEWKSRVGEASARGNVLRFLGELNDGKIRIGVQEVPKNSSFGNLGGTDNLVSIRTEIYDKSPIIVQGPGAGKKVTAQAVLSDILKVVESLGTSER